MSVGVSGQILQSKYRLERELGRGGMGSVWLAQHLTLQSQVAIKLIEPEIATNPEALARFLREAQAAASLRSPHVVQILDHGVDEGVPFIVMELLDGESLAGRLERVQRLSPQETSRIMTQVARAMGRAHEAGIVHRDLKPDNIFLVRNDEEEIAKVLDFGVAKSRTHGMGGVSSATRTGSVLGTPYYMSPEQAEGSKTVDQRSDIWSMGVIAWECLLGTRPFESDTLGGLLLAICAREMPVPSRSGMVPPGFDAWFARACSRDVSYRFATAKEAAQELRALCEAAPLGQSGNDFQLSGGATPAASMRFASTTGQLGVAKTNDAPQKRSRAPVIVVGVLLGCGVIGGAVFALRGGGSATDAAASAAQPMVALPSVEAPKPPPVVEPEPPKPVPPPAASAAVTAAPVVAAPTAAAAVKGAPVHAAARPARSRAAAAAPEPAKPAAAAAAPAPAPAAAPARPRVNLGI
ncbi:MAG TPA: serine/threonine-protein kinase [Polyangiaceae bacterium]|nr:serine/threonine-protein kinase [Polyangiaceae bacterium]